MHRIGKLLRYGLAAVMLGAILGAGLGAVRGAQVVAENEYQAQAPRLARWTLIDAFSDGMLRGALSTLAILGAMLLLLPFCRLLLGNWQRAVRGAALGIPMLAAYLAVAYWVNRSYLPGARSLASIAGNLGLAALAVALWFALVRGTAAVKPGAALARLSALARPIPLLLMFAIVLAAQSARILAKPVADPERSDVLLIVIDALRPDRLGAYGYGRDTSPNLDQLAREGWVWLTAMSTAPWTKPAIASLYTGLYPRSHGISGAGWNRQDEDGATQVSALPQKLQTLAETLAEAGYRTAAYGQNHHLIARLGFNQGFEVHELDVGTIGLVEAVANRLRSEGRGKSDRKKAAGEINDRLLDWLPDGDDRFFAYLHHIDVHWPYRAPPPFGGRYGPRRSKVNFNAPEFYDEFGPERERRDAPVAIDPLVLRDMSDAYDEGIAFVDAELGALFSELKRRGRYDRTLIVITADHGEQFHEHGEIGHGSSLHDVLLRVPLIIKFPCPGVRCGGRRMEEPAQLVDLMPTILDAVGIAAPTEIAGRTLLAPSTEDRAFFAERGDEVALRTGQLKLIYNLDSSDAQLFELQSDPGERTNLAQSDRALMTTLRDRMFVWLEETELGATAPREEVAADRRMLEQLKALGYVK